MTEKTITICGKQVTLGYSYATEIAYKEYTGEKIQSYIAEAAQAVNSQPAEFPDIKKSIYAILSAALAYSDSKDEDIPIKDKDLMTKLTPMELGTAIATIIELWSKFYHIPEGEPTNESEENEDAEKKA